MLRYDMILLVLSSSKSCDFFGPPGTGYADTNLSVVVVNATRPLASCCDACDAWNAASRSPHCRLGVVTQPGNVCALKPSSAQPFAAARATAVRPPPPSPSPEHNLELLVLPNSSALLQGAACLDGTPPAIYMAPANTSADPSAANKWVLYFKGGGWCVDEDDCVARTTTLLGSSSQLPAQQPRFGYGGAGPLGDDPSLNPAFAHFNRVMLWYCDGGSFSGDVAETVPVVRPSASGGNVTTQLHFRGKRNLDAVLRYLRLHHNLGAATEVLLSGGSAGALAVYLHADYVRAGFGAGVKFRAAPVSGFFLMHDTAAGEDAFPARARGVFGMMNSSGGVNQRCVEALAPAGLAWRCFFANASYAYTRTPLFALNSAVDSFQMGAILDIAPACAGLGASKAPGAQFANCSDAELAAVTSYEADFLRDLRGSPAFDRAGSGGFIESCMEHVAAQGGKANTIEQGGTSMMDALVAWWGAPEGAPASEHWTLPCTLHATAPGQCNPSCTAS